MHHTNTRKPIHLFTVERTEWIYPIHRHNHYELVFVEQGNGIHHINDLTEPFQKGDILFIQPNDAHFYTLKSKTIFTYVKFLTAIQNNHTIINRLEMIKDEKAYRYAPYHNCVTDTKDASQMFILLKLMKQEYQINPNDEHHNLLYLLQVMLNIIYRNVHNKPAYTPNINSQKIADILAFLRSSVYESKKVTLSQVAAMFSLSPNYINNLIKKNTELTIHQHLTKYKMETAETLLLHSDKNINEIAHLLGYTDASHFSNTFKKEKKFNPLQYKRQQK